MIYTVTFNPAIDYAGGLTAGDVEELEAMLRDDGNS